MTTALVDNNVAMMEPKSKGTMMKLSDMKTSEQVLAEEMRDPAFRAEWERTAMARAVSLKVLAHRAEHNPTIDTLARIAQALDIEFAIDVRPCEQEPKFINKRAQARDAVASYVSGRATVLLAAG
jgi:hypothetical protein